MDEKDTGILYKFSEFNFESLILEEPKSREELVLELNELNEQFISIKSKTEGIKILLKVAKLFSEIEYYNRAYDYYEKALGYFINEPSISDNYPEILDDVIIGLAESTLYIKEFDTEYDGLDHNYHEYLRDFLLENIREKKTFNRNYRIARAVMVLIVDRYRYRTEQLYNIFGSSSLYKDEFYEIYIEICAKLYMSKDKSVQEFIVNNFITLTNICFSYQDIESFIEILGKLVTYIALCKHEKIPFNKEYLCEYYERLSIYIYGFEGKVEESNKVLNRALNMYGELYYKGVLRNTQSYALALINNGYYNTQVEKFEDALSSYLLGFKIASDLHKKNELRTNISIFSNQIKVFYEDVWKVLKERFTLRTEDLRVFSELVESYRDVFSDDSNKEYYKTMLRETQVDFLKLYEILENRSIQLNDRNEKLETELESKESIIKSLKQEIERIKVKNEFKNESSKSNELMINMLNNLLEKTGNMEKLMYKTNDNLFELKTANEASFKNLEVGQMEIKRDIEELKLMTEQCIKNISAYQNLYGDLINRINREEEVQEELYSSFFEKCISEMKSLFIESKTECNKYHQELINEIGIVNWEKMQEDSKNMLVTSILIKDYLDKLNGQADYSSVCIPIVKALEIEIYNRYFKMYKDYLIRSRKNYDEWPVTMIDTRYNKPIKDTDFTLGSFSYITGCFKASNTTPEEYQNVKNIFLEYASLKLFMDTTSVFDIDSYLKDLNRDVIKVKNDYRNPSAHRNKINKLDAQECFEFVVTVTKLISKIISKCKF